MMFECITFLLADQKYAVDIMRIREVREWEETRPVPNSSDDLIGVLDIRGKIVPIFDLKQQFGFGSSEESSERAIIILKYKEDRIGFVVDAVSDIEKVAESDMKDSDGFNKTTNSDYVESIFSKNGDVTMMIDVDVLFSRNTSTNKIIDESCGQEAAA